MFLLKDPVAEVMVVPLSHIHKQSGEFKGTHTETQIKYSTTTVRVRRPLTGSNTQRAQCDVCRIWFRFDVRGVTKARRDFAMKMWLARGIVGIIVVSAIVFLAVDPVLIAVALLPWIFMAIIAFGIKVWAVLSLSPRKLHSEEPTRVKHSVRPPSVFLTFGT